jgi:hypothetical protein
VTEKLRPAHLEGGLAPAGDGPVRLCHVRP